jgi:hypothetical protein
MPEFADLNQLTQYLNEKIRTALATEVSDIAKETMSDHVMSDVYNKYTPSQSPKGYVRTGDLYKDIQTTMIDDNTLTIENVAKDEETGRMYASIVDEGIGYEWKDSRIYQMQPYPRPFVENTFKELADGKAKQALIDGLKKQGIDVE